MPTPDKDDVRSTTGGDPAVAAAMNAWMRDRLTTRYSPADAPLAADAPAPPRVPSIDAGAQGELTPPVDLNAVIRAALGR